MNKINSLKNYLMASIIFLILICHFACLPDAGIEGSKLNITQTANRSWGDVNDMIRETFRIDVKSISVIFDYYPEAYYSNCAAVVKFVMQPGQKRALIHLDPAIRNKNIVTAIKLNGQLLDILKQSDVKVVEFDHSTQKGLEFQRDLLPGVEHTFEIAYRLDFTKNYYLLATQVNDFSGRGNEELFPTINSPHDLARHSLTFRVHSNIEFRCIGSGYIQKSNKTNCQEWVLDSEREIASYTLMFVLIPAEDTLLQQRMIDGVKVTVVSFIGGESIEQAFSLLEPWLPELRQNLGPFPMPRGLSIFLMSEGGGMEYFGGTISSLWALEHEVFHMYFACSTVQKTYRDSWLDEAINKWYEYSASTGYQPIWETFASNMVSGRSPVAVGFDIRAYDEGSRILQEIAIRLGGREEMIKFLKYLHTKYIFQPFTTMDFVEYLKEYSGIDMTAAFTQWLYQGETITNAVDLSQYRKRKHQVKIVPPQWILDKYTANGGINEK